MNRICTFLLLAIGLCWLSACEEEQVAKQGKTKQNISKIFEKLSAQESGIRFTNNLKEDSVINYFTYPYLYMGGGVAIGDVNNDGFQDIFLTGNMVSNKLYLNTGKDLVFKDITEIAKVGGDDRWMTGVTMADVNADGWLDIYVSVSGKFASKKNLLYLNDGILKDGIPSFTEVAEERGIADEGSSTQGTFFDYDKDGDLDLYVANYPSTHFKTPAYSYRIFLDQKKPEKSDRLYQNDGNGFFKDVTEAAGILNFGLSLSATVGDLNQDGWEDIYVSNDFAAPDFLYLNNGDGTFREVCKQATQHTSFFGMGTDIGDFNNDGLLDILQMDMTPEDNRRNKANMASMNIAGFWEIVNLGMHYQYMQNTLQINNGITGDGIPHFSDVSRIGGLSSTDWSWAGLFADLDNDGHKDVFVTNGTRKDINNKDYFNKIEKATYKEKQSWTKLDLSKGIPSERIDNYVFKNNGNFSFTPVVKEWGLSHEGYSNGAAYADLDNDGDLDMVINNIDDPSIVYRNTTVDQGLGNFLRIKLQGTDKNPQGLGTKITLKNNDQLQYQELTLSRGFQSSVEPVLHFGLGDSPVIQSLEIVWPDGKAETIKDIKANQVLTVDYKNALAENEQSLAFENPPIFKNVNTLLKLNHIHRENTYDDYQHEILIPHMYSRNGPGLAVGDVNGDQLEDFFIGSAVGDTARLYLQNADGSFRQSFQNDFSLHASHEDMSAELFDADQDGDLDLYVVSGSNEFKEGDQRLQDRFYLNDGRGNFIYKKDVLPALGYSGSRVKVADYDQDGDLDLFVGGRIVPRSYPLPAKSFIFKNEWKETGNLKFTDVTESLAPGLKEAGLVTDAAWVDFDNDKKMDLVLVGEWMPLTFLKNTGEGFVDQTLEYGLEKTTGWWYSLTTGDFDNDGDMDFVAGNLGLNYKYQASEEESFDVYANDYDRNGKMDIVLGYYNDGVQFPLRGRQCSSEQIPTIKYKFKNYDSFAEASLEDVYTKEDLENSLHYQARTFASTYIENRGDGIFVLKQLPRAAQLSNINDGIAQDFNQDGNLDILVAGNLYAAEVETPRNDAGYGLLLLGDGKGNFKEVAYSKSGVFINKDTKDLALIKTVKGMVILAANNNDALVAISYNFSETELQ